MPAIQTVYTTNISPARAGFIADMTQADLISRTVENAGGIAFGFPVAQGVADKGCIPFAGTKFLGFAVRERSVVSGEQFAQYDSARVMIKGPIWVNASVAVAAGDPVYVTAAGLVTNVASGNTAVPNARFSSSTTGAALAEIFIK
jgi:hypothetical protein